MSHRDPRRPIVPDPEDRDATDRERSFRSRRVAGSRPPDRESERAEARPADEIAWLDDDTSSSDTDAVDTFASDDPRGLGHEPLRTADTSRRPRLDDPADPTAWAEVTEEWAAETDQGWDEIDAPLDVPAAPTRRPASPRRARATTRLERRRTRSRPRPHLTLPSVRMPSVFANAELMSDRTAVILLVANIVSLAAMAIVVGSQISSLPPILPIHLDPAGRPDRWGPPRLLWRLPLLAAMTTLINLVLAWFLVPLDRFVGRFLLAASLVVHLIAWIAVFDFI
ncbi:MAG: hypothetical protein M3354_01115 [Chloroflexota bacterium]|nr:hypothetical protein [Chloroflexota bacterium]